MGRESFCDLQRLESWRQGFDSGKDYCEHLLTVVCGAAHGGEERHRVLGSWELVQSRSLQARVYVDLEDRDDVWPSSCFVQVVERART